jgi:hypothetical protein
MRNLVFVLFTFYSLIVCAQVERKVAYAVKTESAPIIDGTLDDPEWSRAKAIADFSQNLPLFGRTPSFKSEVRILYDDQAIYIGAFMSDPHPDSIPMQLGNRDDENMNVDYFGVEFDTYNNQLDAFTFIVTAAGVQIDSRESDETFDGVWMSAAKRNSLGWNAEMKIPYSAIRFPNIPNQNWGLQIIRYIRRYRETDFWSPEQLGADNDLVYWGELHSIENIKPPVRLSVTPYLALAAEHFPDPSGKDISTSFSGGMDLKYGLNESFTVDMTLLPDFSQVQSDNKVKNLTAFETVYSEQRPFFKEAVDLFQKGDLFYSRRIGKIPENFDKVEGMLEEGEKLTKNPVQQRLLNATKLSGRTNKGLAIGILNAVTANTYATLQNSSGIKRKVLTDPASNYNMLVLAQALKNNSEIYISNSNLIRSKGYDDANVTAAGIELNDHTNTYVLNINGAVSQNYLKKDTLNNEYPVKVGYKYFAGIGKTNGNFQFTIVKGALNPDYNANGMGITLYNNYNLNYASLSYNVYKPWWLLRDIHNTVTLQNENNFTTHKVQTASLEINSYCTSMKYLSMWINAGFNFLETYNYYEPRKENRYYRDPKLSSYLIGISSDYRKTFALDATLNVAYGKRDNTKETGGALHPIIRVNDHFIFEYVFNYNQVLNQIGHADLITDSGMIIFGKRDVYTIINTLTGKYLFRNNLSLNLVARHYWEKGLYSEYYNLLENGYLRSDPSYTGNKDFNFNAFTIDMVFAWLFAPGSSINVVWKNSIDTDDAQAANRFFTNLKNTLDSPQRNVLSFKILYYLDYQQLKRKHQPR